jgi:hypothetical protein
MFVTNLADAYTEAVGDEIEEKVTRYTVSHITLPPKTADLGPVFPSCRTDAQIFRSFSGATTGGQQE